MVYPMWTWGYVEVVCDVWARGGQVSKRGARGECV